MFEAIAHVLAAFSIIYFARTVFSGRAKDPQQLLSAALGVLIMTIFTHWPVHAAAGMLLGLLFPLAFSRSSSPKPMLWALACAVAFAIFGASWVMIPAVIAAALWVLQGNGGAALAQLFGRSPLAEPTPEALPEQAGGLPIMGQQGEKVAVPAQPAATPAAKAQAQPTFSGDALSALHHETRLPAAIRAQLVALDQRTAEALKALAAQGNVASEALFQARAIRNEYAPASVQAYLKLPPTQANTVPIENGKTGRDLLADQLDLLLSAAQKILDATVRSGSQDLLSNGRFLRDKFGGSEQDLKV